MFTANMTGNVVLLAFGGADVAHLGEWDWLSPREEQDHLAAAIFTARVVVVPATGHSPNWERPEQVADDLAAFMHEA